MTRDRRLTLLLGVIMLVAALGLKWWYRTAGTEELGFMLEPVSMLVGLLTDSASTYTPEEGYTFHALAIRIDRSCSGVNFLIIALASFAVLILRRADGGCARPFLLFLAVPTAYVLAMVANTSRIVSTLVLQRFDLLAAPHAHEAFGAFVFIGFLLLAVLLFHRALPRPMRQA